MKKRMLLAMMATVVISSAIGCGAAAKAAEVPEAAEAQADESRHSTYPWAGVVTAIDPANDLVTISTASGLLYEFYADSDDITVGDIMAVTMDDGGTPENVLDDAVIDAKYAGCSYQFNNIIMTQN